MKVLKRLLAVIGMILMYPFGFLILCIFAGSDKACSMMDYLVEQMD